MKKVLDDSMDVFSEIPNQYPVDFQYPMIFQFSINDKSWKVLSPHRPLDAARISSLVNSEFWSNYIYTVWSSNIVPAETPPQLQQDRPG